jgi:hypothetical protein
MLDKTKRFKDYHADEHGYLYIQGHPTINYEDIFYSSAYGFYYYNESMDSKVDFGMKHTFKPAMLIIDGI